MAYEAHKWKIGEEITSDKLNHIEKGIEEAGLPREITDPQDGQTLKYDAASGKWVNGEGGSGGATPLVVNIVADGSNQRMDHTWQEINDAFPNVYVLKQTESLGNTYTTKFTITTVREGMDMVEGTNSYDVYFYNNNTLMTFRTDTTQGYPYQDGIG